MAQNTEAAKPDQAQSAMEMGSPGEQSSLIDTFRERAADLHSTIARFPVAWVMLLVLLWAWLLTRGRPTPEIGLPLAILAALSILPTALTGLPHAQERASAAPALQDATLFHHNLALVAGGLMGLAAGLRLRLRRRPSTGLQVAYWVVLSAVPALSLSDGRQGGIIAHSEMWWTT